MTNEPIEVVELGQAEALIELCCGQDEEIWDKFTAKAVYVEFDGPV